VKKKILIALVVLAALLTSAGPVLAGPPPDNPGKGHPEFDKLVFVHYTDNFIKKNRGGSSAPQLFSYSGYHWADSSVLYWINLNGSRTSGTDVINGVRASFQTWQDDPGSQIFFSYQGTTATVPGVDASAPDYQNVVGWAYLSASYPRAIAVTVAWATRGDKHIVDCDTILNTDSYFAWTQAANVTEPNTALLPPTYAYDVDIQNIMTHESGHWLQLNDLGGSAASEQTMYGIAADRELKKRSLESGDLAGIGTIYPQVQRSKNSKQ
jgi:hypothetical protein